MLLLLATAACSTTRKEFDANPPFAPHYYRNVDVEVTWQAVRTGQDVQLSGAVTNRRSAYLRDLELTVRLLDDKGAALARETVMDFPTYIPSGKAAPFQVKLSLPPGTTPARLRVNYTYLLTEEPPAVRGFSGTDDIPHFGRFDAPP
jgi:hypothetical protein